MGCSFCGYSPCLCGRQRYDRSSQFSRGEGIAEYLERVYPNDCPSCGALLTDCRCGTLDMAPEPEFP